MSKEHDLLAGYSLAKQVKELASWLGNAPGWVQIPDRMFDSLDEMAITACNTIGLAVPDKDLDHGDDPIDMVCTWLKEWDENHPDE